MTAETTIASTCVSLAGIGMSSSATGVISTLTSAYSGLVGDADRDAARAAFFASAAAFFSAAAASAAAFFAAAAASASAFFSAAAASSWAFFSAAAASSWRFFSAAAASSLAFLALAKAAFCLSSAAAAAAACCSSASRSSISSVLGVGLMVIVTAERGGIENQRTRDERSLCTGGRRALATACGAGSRSSGRVSISKERTGIHRKESKVCEPHLYCDTAWRYNADTTHAWLMRGSERQFDKLPSVYSKRFSLSAKPSIRYGQLACSARRRCAALISSQVTERSLPFVPVFEASSVGASACDMVCDHCDGGERNQRLVRLGRSEKERRSDSVRAGRTRSGAGGGGAPGAGSRFSRRRAGGPPACG